MTVTVAVKVTAGRRPMDSLTSCGGGGLATACVTGLELLPWKLASPP